MSEEPTNLYEACRRAAARAEPAFVANHWKWKGQRDGSAVPDADAILDTLTHLCRTITDIEDANEPELTARSGRLRVIRELDDDGPAWTIALELITWIPE